MWLRALLTVIMCFGLAPGFVLKDEIAEELLAEFDPASTDSSEAAADETPSFASEEGAGGTALTGAMADDDEFGGSPR
jgi:hypothetical protein